MKIFPSGISMRGSFKRQIILTFVVGFFFLITAFAAYLVNNERGNLYRDSVDETTGLAESLAVSSRSWVLANDVAGLQEVVRSFKNYPALRYTMVISPTGRVLAHSDAAKVGQFISDEKSLALLKAHPRTQTMMDNEHMVDVAVPISVNNRFVGWARIGLGREKISGELQKMMLISAFFVLLSTVLSLFAAILIASRLGYRIGSLVRVAEQVQAGNFSTRASIPGGEDEVTKLANNFNQMLDVLARNEKELRVGSLYTRSLIEASLDPLVTISAEGKITDVNQATETVTGKSRSKLIGTDFSDYFTEPHKAREGYQQVFAKGFITDYPLALRHRDGHLTEVLYNASIYRDEAGHVLGVFAAARDVTERNKAEQEVAQLSLRNKLILDSAGEGIYGLDIDGRCTFINPAALQILGFSAEELLGQHSHPMFHHTKPDGSPYSEDECPVQAAYKQGEVHRGDDLYWRKDGHNFSVEFISTPVLESGTITGAVVAFRDITERKLAEEKLSRSERGLAEAQRIAHLGNWDIDLVQNELIWSDEIYRIFEIDPEKFGASYEAFLSAIHPDDRELVNNAYTESIKNKTPYDIEHRLLMKDGRVKYVNEKCETYYGEDGKPLRSVGAVHDITDRKKTEEELMRYKDHLEEVVQQRTADLALALNAAEAANRAKSVFLSSMSHELRTPMNAILGFSNMMRKDPLLSQEQRENLDIINRSGNHLLTLINDVLDMAKIEAGRVQLERAPIDLGALLHDVTDMMHMRAQEKGLQLLIDQSSAFPRYIMGDEMRLRQVLINLIGNAVKFTQHGSITLRLAVKSSGGLQRLLIEVEDTGIGIKPEDQQKIFEPFVQLEKMATQTGTGLGLTLTRQYLQLMGGTISVKSTLGKGSIFQVKLPLEKVAAADVVAKPESEGNREVVSLAPNQPEYRILIVEDQLDNQLLLTQLMKNVGFQVKVADNGEQAVGLFQSWQPHLIWMDRRMPVMDGLEATRRIRELPGGKEVKIVAVTASAVMEQRDEMLNAGMDEFVRKPYRFNEIYECMTRQLGVQYTYADTREAALTTEMLAVLPADLCRELHDALESLEGERIAAVIQQVEAYDSTLHKTLSRLVENFDYPAILKALQTNQTGNVT